MAGGDEARGGAEGTDLREGNVLIMLAAAGPVAICNKGWVIVKRGGREGGRRACMCAARGRGQPAVQ